MRSNNWMTAYTSPSMRPSRQKPPKRYGFDLQESLNSSSRPQSVAVRRRLPNWQRLMAKYKARGEWLRLSTLLDTFTILVHGIVNDDTLITTALGTR